MKTLEGNLCQYHYKDHYKGGMFLDLGEELRIENKE